MPLLTWDGAGQKKFEAGVENCVLFVMGSDGTYGTGVPWNGLTNFSANSTGAEETELWADDLKYGSLLSAEKVEGNIQAYTFPIELYPCLGMEYIGKGVLITQQSRSKCAVAVLTKVGNDTQGLDHGYKIHIVYGISFKPTEMSYESINDSPSVAQFSFDYTTVPQAVANKKPTSHIIIDSTHQSSIFNTVKESVFAGTMMLPDAIISAAA